MILRVPLLQLCLAASGVLAPNAGIGQRSADKGFVSARSRRIDSIFAMYDTGRSPGCAVGVMDRGQIEYAHGYGLANVASGVRITPRSVFGLASVAKQFTAFSVLLLVQDGRLSLDDDVRKWVPELPDFGAQFGRTITIRDLLHHTSGIPNYFATVDSGWTDTDPLTERDVLDWLGHQKPDFPPGSRWRYSNSGYVLLEIIVQRASGDSLPKFAAKRIFGPLGMASTQFVPDPADHVAQIPHLARTYNSQETWLHGEKPLVKSGPEWQISLPHMSIVGDAGVYSTVEDLAKWDRNFYTGRVGGRAVLQMMQEPAVLTSGDTVSAPIAPGWRSYGAGLMLGAYRGLRTVGHLGGWSGNVAWFVRYPDQLLTVTVLCNQRGLTMPGGSDPTHRIAEIYLGDRMAPDIAPLMAMTVAHAGVDSAVHLYHTLLPRYPAIVFDEQQLNGLGYDLIHQHNLDAAIAIFRLNVEMYPKSANAYDSLGEAYMDHEDRTLAIASYERSLALDSTNANAARRLAKLRAQAP
jgi:CubicO group peptidase (beta-lactamase class C family)